MNGRARRLAVQWRFELRLLLRNGENLLITLGLPVGLLVFFSLVDVLPAGERDAVDVLVPGVLVLAVMGAGMVSLAISTGFERHYLVLKRLGATPLRRGELIGAKLAAVLTIEAVQIVLVIGAGFALGWRPHAGAVDVVVAVATLALATAAFCGLGMLLAGRLPALGTLAVANGLFVVLLLISGVVLPLGLLPGALRTIAMVFPAAPAVGLLQQSFGQDVGPLPLAVPAVLVAWAVAAPALAARLFRWA